MDRKNWFFGQALSQADLDAAFDQVESGDRNLVVDRAATGIISGGVAAYVGGTTISVDAFKAYDKAGRRLIRASGGSMSVATATDGSSTIPPSGQWRWVSIVARFGRSLSDSRLDGLGGSVSFNEAEALVSTGDSNSSNVGKLQVLKGTAALTSATPTRPTIGANDILVCDLLMHSTGLTGSSDVYTDRTDRYVIQSSASPRTSDFLQVAEFCNDNVGSTKVRIYISPAAVGAGDGGIAFSYNARWDAIAAKWTADSTSYHACLYTLGVGGLIEQHKVTTTTPWTAVDWDP